MAGHSDFRTVLSDKYGLDFDDCQAVTEAAEFISFAKDLYDAESSRKNVRILVATEVVGQDIAAGIPDANVRYVRDAVSAAAALIEEPVDLLVCDLTVLLDPVVRDICRRGGAHCRIALLSTWGGQILSHSDLLSESDRIIPMDRVGVELSEFVHEMSAEGWIERQHE